MMPTTAHDEEPAATGCEVVRQRADALLEEFGALMADISRDPDRPDLARRMVTMAAALREVRAAVSGHALADDLADAIEARAEARGYKQGLAAAGRRKGRHASQGSFFPRLVQVIVLAAGGTAALLRRSLARHPVLAAARTALAAHKVVAAAAGSAVFAGGTAAVMAVSGLGPAAALPWTGSSAGPAPAATAYAASPLPSSSPIALLVTRPKAKHSAKGDAGLSGSGAQVPPWSSGPDPSATSPGPSPSASASAAGPAALSLGGVTSLDLSSPLDPQATFTLAATGSGWVSWRISTSGTDLDFSQDQGVLQAGQSVTLTVSVDPAQALDGNTQQVFKVDGQQVTVALPPLVPSVSPSAAVSIPPVLPSPASS